MNSEWTTPTTISSLTNLHEISSVTQRVIRLKASAVFGVVKRIRDNDIDAHSNQQVQLVNRADS